jgi:predicted phage tail protein
MARLVLIHNPFDIIGSREILDTDNNLNIKEILDTYFYKDKACKLDVIITCNGQKVEDYAYQPSVFDLIGVYPIPYGGGGGGKQVFKMVALVALAFTAPHLMTMLPGAGALGASGAVGWGVGFAKGAFAMTTVGKLVAGGIYLAGALLINAVLPASLPNVSSSSSTSATYNWDGMTNPVREGSPLPILYGTHRVSPPIIAEYLSQDGDKQYYNALYAVAGHQIDSISQIKINDQALETYSNIITQTRLGENDQTAIPGFSDIRVDTGVSAIVKYGTPITKETTGNSCNGLGVSLLFNRGLYYANDNGGFNDTSVKVQMLYRLAGTSDPWQRLALERETVTSTAFEEVGRTVIGTVYKGYALRLGIITYRLLNVNSSPTITFTLNEPNRNHGDYGTLIDVSYDGGVTWEQVFTAEGYKKK